MRSKGVRWPTGKEDGDANMLARGDQWRGDQWHEGKKIAHSSRDRTLVKTWYTLHMSLTSHVTHPIRGLVSDARFLVLLHFSMNHARRDAPVRQPRREFGAVVSTDHPITSLKIHAKAVGVPEVVLYSRQACSLAACDTNVSEHDVGRTQFLPRTATKIVVDPTFEGENAA